MTRGPYPGWSLVEDGYLDEPEPVPEPPRRFGCLSFAVLVLVLVAGVPAPRTAVQSNGSGIPGSALIALRDGASSKAELPSGASERTASRSVVADAPPSGAIGTALYTASATWCAPTPTQCQGWGGNARLAAVNSFRYGDEPYPVRVHHGDIYVDVTVVSFCACRGTLHAIDLSPSAFAILAPLSRGRIDVAVEVLVDLPPDPRDDAMRDEVRDVLPATDVAR